MDEIVPWAASRSVVQWRVDRGVRAREKWAATAREAAKQARRAWLPVVAGAPDESTATVARRIVGAGAAFVLHEEADERTGRPAMAERDGHPSGRRQVRAVAGRRDPTARPRAVANDPR